MSDSAPTLSQFRHFRAFPDAVSVALAVGGSLVIPKVRRAVACLEELPPA